MCGICGFNWSDKELIRKMTEKIRHRGPDAMGYEVFQGFSVGNVRLSILDLSVNGNQPMQSEEGRYWIVYNGEIYNFPELKKELLEKGYRFKSNTDTETVLYSYQEHGPECLNRFNGMFALAIWDAVEQTLFLARDRIGIKPLYYYFSQGRFIFGSEIKSILLADCVNREVNLQSFYHYLGYEFVPAPLTMFKNIYKLKQGHYAIFKNGDLSVHPYWNLRFNEKKMEDHQEMIESIFQAMERSVKRRLLSDVPVGVFLSGGLDSSMVASYAAKLYPQKLETFSIGYEDKTFSELPYAKQVSDYLGTNHNVLMIEPVAPVDIEKSLYHLDEPMTDLSTIPFFLISQKAREKVKVCLSGEGGDEIFMGYDRFKAAKMHKYYSCIPGLVREYGLNPLILSFPDQPQKKGLVNMLKRFIEGGRYPDFVGAMRWQFFFDPENEKKLFRNGLEKDICFDPFDPIFKMQQDCNSNDPVDRDIFVDIKLTMADSVLMKVDKMSMATSLEVRVPFLDHEVVELCAGIPSSLKLKGFTTKYILRETLKKHDFLPENIIYRGKQGYSLPVKNWLREDLKDYMVHLLSTSPLLLEYLNQDYIQSLIGEHIKRQHNHNHILWALMNLAIWHQKFFQ